MLFIYCFTFDRYAISGGNPCNPNLTSWEYNGSAKFPCEYGYSGIFFRSKEKEKKKKRRKN